MKNINKSRSKHWFSAKCIFQHYKSENGHRQIYEERIILLKSININSAMKSAEKEAKVYAKQCSDCRYTGYIEIFKLFDNNIVNMTEIYSETRQSKLLKNKYLDRYYPDKILNDCTKHGMKHRWYNKDNIYNSCYHCEVVEKRHI